MNIFYTSHCPVECAKYLDDKRVVKMVLETAQMICVSLMQFGETVPYKPTHTNHPCTRWACESPANLRWLYEHFKALCSEYTARYGKVHRCERIMPEMPSYVLESCASEMTDLPDCTTYKTEEWDLCTKYRAYLCDKWEQDKRTPTWHGMV